MLHQADYCHSRCGNNCEDRCSECGNTTLTTLTAGGGDDVTATVRHATALAQQRAAKGEVGDIEVTICKLDSRTGKIRELTVSYNTYSQDAGYIKTKNW